MLYFFFFFNDTATTEIYTLSLHDALPILKVKGLAPGERSSRGQAQTPRPNLDVLPLSLLGLLLHVVKYRFEVFWTVHQRLAMIGERQRDQPAPSQKTVDLAEHHTAAQFLAT